MLSKSIGSNLVTAGTENWWNVRDLSATILNFYDKETGAKTDLLSHDIQVRLFVPPISRSELIR